MVWGASRVNRDLISELVAMAFVIEPVRTVFHRRRTNSVARFPGSLQHIPLTGRIGGTYMGSTLDVHVETLRLCPGKARVTMRLRI